MKFPFPKFEQIKRDYKKAQQSRSELIGRSDDALRRSKKAIFAFHRADTAGALKLLKEVHELLNKADTLIKKSPSLKKTGAYRAALEEYAEAQLFGLFVGALSAKELDRRIFTPDTYLSGLSDVLGEMARYAILHATNHNRDAVESTYRTAETVMDALVEMDLTGPLRNKFDQAKNHFRKIEQIRYELSLRHHSST